MFHSCPSLPSKSSTCPLDVDGNVCRTSHLHWPGLSHWPGPDHLSIKCPWDICWTSHPHTDKVCPTVLSSPPVQWTSFGQVDWTGQWDKPGQWGWDVQWTRSCWRTDSNEMEPVNSGWTSQKVYRVKCGTNGVDFYHNQVNNFASSFYFFGPKQFCRQLSLMLHKSSQFLPQWSQVFFLTKPILWTIESILKMQATHF